MAIISAISFHDVSVAFLYSNHSISTIAVTIDFVFQI